MKNQKTIIITGTHHTPAIELIDLLRHDLRTSWKIIYIGHQYSAETHIGHTIIPKLKIPFYELNCGKFDRKDPVKSFFGIFVTVTAFLKSLSLINRLKPDIVVSFGGYVSVPVIAAAYFNKTPSITHEQTLTTSLSTKINSYFVNKVALSFNDPIQVNKLPSKKVVYTGNLLRQAIFNNHSSRFSQLKTNNLPILYITGGNQGSEFLNKLTQQLLPDLEKKYFVIHQCGNNFKPPHIVNYFSTPYIEIEDIGWIFNHAQIIISRAGANTCQELDILHKKAILIPLPYSQQNEQFLNANWLQQRQPNSTIIIAQTEAKVPNILRAILKLSVQSTSKTPVKKIRNLNFLQLIHELT